MTNVIDINQRTADIKKLSARLDEISMLVNSSRRDVVTVINDFSTDLRSMTFDTSDINDELSAILFMPASPELKNIKERAQYLFNTLLGVNAVSNVILELDTALRNSGVILTDMNSAKYGKY